MGHPLRSSHLIPVLCAGLCGLSGIALGAQGDCANAQIDIQADQPADIDFRNNNALLRNVVITQCDMRVEAGEARISGGIDFQDSQWQFSGNVRITAEGGSLKSDKAVVSFRNNLISRAIITGSPAQFEQKRKDGLLARGHAATMDYETASGTVSFRDDAWLSDGCNEITGPQLVYNIRTQSVGGAATRSSSTENGRIRITIKPGDGSGNRPCVPSADPKP